MCRLPRWVRYAMWSALGAVVLVASGVIAWRVLGPAEVATKAVSTYPSAAVPASGPIGALISSPLIVDERLRVYAAKRQVQADDQPGYRYEKSPFWSFRRWPQQLIGVVHPPTTATSGVPVVVSSWSDGALIGLDARTGEVAWRADGDVLGAEYPGRRTGSAVVWTPAGLLTGVASDQQAVVVTSVSGKLAGYDAATGGRLWAVDAPAGACGAAAFTVAGVLLVPDSCDAPHALLRYDLGTGAQSTWDLHGFTGAVTITPLGCRIAGSECGGVRAAQTTIRATAWLWRSGAEPVEASGLASTTALLAGSGGGVAVDAPLGDTVDTRALTGKDPRTGAVRWTWSRGGDDSTSARLIAATPDRILLLTRVRTLIALDPATGRELNRSAVLLKQDPKQPYSVGPVYATGPYVAIERQMPDAGASATDDQYYYSARPVLLAAS